jgi:hypothetical protein
VELAPVRVQFREWPGFAGPLVFVDANAELGPHFAPAYRVLSLAASETSPAVRAAHVAELLDIFGFDDAVLIGGPVAALVAQQRRVAGLVLVNWSGPQPDVTCPLLIVHDESQALDALEAFVAGCTRCPSSD